MPATPYRFSAPLAALLALAAALPAAAAAAETKIGCASGTAGQVLRCGSAGTAAWATPPAEADPLYTAAPAHAITAPQVSAWDAAASGVRPLIALGDIDENLLWTAHGSDGTARLVAADLQLDVQLPAAGSWWSSLELTADCEDCELSVGNAYVAVDMAPLRPGIGGRILVLIHATPERAAIATVPLQ